MLGIFLIAPSNHKLLLWLQNGWRDGVMKFLQKLICVLCIYACGAPVEAAQQPSLLIIDTEGHQAYYNRTLISLAQSVGFTVTYQTLYEFLEKEKSVSFDATFFLFGLTMIQHMHSDIGSKLLKTIQKFNTQTGKTVGLFLPGSNKYSPELLAWALQLTHSLRMFTQKNDNSLKCIAQSFLHYLLQPDILHGLMHGTTLINPKSTSFPLISDSQGTEFTQRVDLYTNEIIATVLPQNSKTLPKGLYIKNTETNNRYFITKTSEFSVADIAENFFRVPIHAAQRTMQLQAAQQTLWELYQACINGAMPIAQPPRPELPTTLTTEYKERTKKEAEAHINATFKKNNRLNWIAQEGITAAWEAPSDYFLHEDSTIHTLSNNDIEKANQLKAEALCKGIQLLFDADINLVWFEFNSELFFSSRGKYKNKKAEFIAQVTLIATEFKKIYRNKKLPKIFIGTDITTNFGVELPKNTVSDVFGTHYSKIPSPLDITHFWKPELMDAFDAYVNAIGSILPIDGLFLDFEMYHAPEQAGSYTELMDFSDSTWNVYRSKNPTIPPLKSAHLRVDYLKNNALFANYFTTLENAAMHLGKTIKNHVRKRVPNILIAAYAQTLPSSWFYRGIMAGLSSAQEPLILTTFNVDFYSHYHWLQEHNIHLVHGAPILLSKLDTPESFGLIDELLQSHYFVWLSRPSRMVYNNKKNQWWSAEACELDTKTLANGINKTNTHKRKKRKHI